MRAGFVAVIGRPNVGKSTLVNRVVGMPISIVTPKAQTTRDRILGIYTEKDQGQMIFIDTPGIHRAKTGGLNEYMIQEVDAALGGKPSVIWYLVDPKSRHEYEQTVLDRLKGLKTPLFLLLNKIDILQEKEALRVRAREMMEILEKSLTQTASLPCYRSEISALSGAGIAELIRETWHKIPGSELLFPDQDQVSDRPEKYFVSELIREQLLLQLNDEVPYSCAVRIEKFDEKQKLTRIEASILVERESQKPIIIGHGGKMIKNIGVEARKKVEAFLGRPVFLGLQVKVMSDWSKKTSTLEKLGYRGSTCE